MSTHALRTAVLRYRDVLSLPGARRFTVSAAVARQGVAMYGLAILFAVRGSGASFAAAGLTTAAFAVAEAVVGPQVARAIDRRGQARVLVVTLPLHTAAIAGLVLTTAGHGPITVVVSTAAAAGAFVPQPGALSAARWAQVVPDPATLSTALSIEAAVNDVVFLVAPSAVVFLSVTVDSLAALVVAPVLLVGGSTALAAQRRTEPAPQPHITRVSGPRLRSARFIRLLAVNLAMGVFFGAAPIGVTAATVAFGAAPSAGPILGAAGVASVVTGLVVGARSRGDAASTALGVAATVLAVAGALLALAPGPVTLAVGYLVAGGTVSAVLIPAAVLLRLVVPAAVYTQALTWANSASAAGIAISAPLGGLVVDTVGWRGVFPLAVLGVAAVPLLARRCR